MAVIVAGAAKRKFWPDDDYRELRTSCYVEFWGINNIRPVFVPRWNRTFNIHRFALLEKYGYPTDWDVMWHTVRPHVKFYSADKWGDWSLPNWHIFPREQLQKMPRGDYHCNSADWLIAFAIHEGFDEIRFHGWILALNAVSEQMSARACFEYWAGYAEGKGIKIVTAGDCDMFYAYHLVKSERVYGYDDCPAYEDRTRGAPVGAPYRYDDE